MVSARTKYIGGGATATLLGLLLWFSLSYHFELELEGDKICAGTFEEPCEASYNITLVNPLVSVFYIQNKDNYLELLLLVSIEFIYVVVFLSKRSLPVKLPPAYSTGS